jgi:hypothetical protein
MKATPKAGLMLGILVVAWTFVMGVTGWYKDPVKQYFFYVVVLIEIGVLVWGLRLTAKEGKTYGGQVGAGTLMAVIGAVIIFFGSIFFTTVAYPNYFTEIHDIGRQTIMAQGLTAEQADAQLKLMEPMQTPLVQALLGAVMTVVTGFVASLVIAAVLRKKPAAQV